MVHFTASILALSAATAVMAGSFAAPAHPAGLVNRQTNKEQILRRQAHGMQKMKRQNAPSAVPVNRCGAPAAFVVQFSGLSNTEEPARQAIENDYAVLVTTTTEDGDIVTVGHTESLAEASVFSLDGSAGGDCNMIDSATGRIADTNGSDNNNVLFDTPQDLVDFQMVAATCRINAGALACTAGDGNTFKICKNDVGGDVPVTYFLALNGADNMVEGCTDVTVTTFLA